MKLYDNAKRIVYPESVWHHRHDAMRKMSPIPRSWKYSTLLVRNASEHRLNETHRKKLCNEI